MFCYCTEGKEGPRRKIVDNGLKLVITDLCKDCTGEGKHTSDLMNVQCMAENEHNYTFADAYLNVLRKYNRDTTCAILVLYCHALLTIKFQLCITNSWF